jgi:phosphohistidine phosphatase SixA
MRFPGIWIENLIYLLRHGDAGASGGDDATRRLTAKGARQARDAGTALAALGAAPAACLTSPRVRAAETARLAGAPLGLEAEAETALGGGAFDSLSLTAGRGDVLLVGHEPDLSNEVARLTGARVKMRKGGIAAIDGSTLLLLLGPAELAAIAAAAR